ncbi:hypothetical protein MACA111363_02575 [Macrococcoides canis]|uniref:Uncharacterized protein n=1 Tax=Macrococcoides canis TaxID=1855823 RepID=A0A1W7ABT3_9STAP|nr:hypothetical protein [Macrococcus canis]ARQ07024.1 hypothetical protein MCCS_13830 [Macrococcus canis]
MYVLFEYFSDYESPIINIVIATDDITKIENFISKENVNKIMLFEDETIYLCLNKRFILKRVSLNKIERVEVIA